MWIISGTILAINRSKRRKGQLKRAFFKTGNLEKLATVRVVETNRRGYQHEWTGSTYRSLMVSACYTFHRYSSVRIMCLGDYLSSDQTLSKGGNASVTNGGRRGSGRLKFVRKGSVRVKAGRSLSGCTSLPARKSLGYRHINRFLAYERADSLQSSHYRYIATSDQSIPPGCVARCGACSQRYQAAVPAPRSRLAWAGALN